MAIYYLHLFALLLAFIAVTQRAVVGASPVAKQDDDNNLPWQESSDSANTAEESEEEDNGENDRKKRDTGVLLQRSRRFTAALGAMGANSRGQGFKQYMKPGVAPSELGNDLFGEAVLPDIADSDIEEYYRSRFTDDDDSENAAISRKKRDTGVQLQRSRRFTAALGAMGANSRSQGLRQYLKPGVSPTELGNDLFGEAVLPEISDSDIEDYYRSRFTDDDSSEKAAISRKRRDTALMEIRSRRFTAALGAMGANSRSQGLRQYLKPGVSPSELGNELFGEAVLPDIADSDIEEYYRSRFTDDVNSEKSAISRKKRDTGVLLQRSRRFTAALGAMGANSRGQGFKQYMKPGVAPSELSNDFFGDAVLPDIADSDIEEYYRSRFTDDDDSDNSAINRKKRDTGVSLQRSRRFTAALGAMGANSRSQGFKQYLKPGVSPSELGNELFGEAVLPDIADSDIEEYYRSRFIEGLQDDTDANSKVDDVESANSRTKREASFLFYRPARFASVLRTMGMNTRFQVPRQYPSSNPQLGDPLGDDFGAASLPDGDDKAIEEYYRKHFVDNSRDYSETGDVFSDSVGLPSDDDTSSAQDKRRVVINDHGYPEIVPPSSSQQWKIISQNPSADEVESQELIIPIIPVSGNIIEQMSTSADDDYDDDDDEEDNAVEDLIQAANQVAANEN